MAFPNADAGRGIPVAQPVPGTIPKAKLAPEDDGLDPDKGEWQVVADRSSNVEAFRWVKAKQKLYVKYQAHGKHPIREYVYDNFSLDEYLSMKWAVSTGKFVWARLRGKHPYSRLS